PLRTREINNTLRCSEPADRVNARAFSQIEDFNAVVSQRAHEQSIAGRVDIEMIDPALDSGEWNSLLQVQRFCRRPGSHETVAERPDNDSKKEVKPAIQDRRDDQREDVVVTPVASSAPFIPFAKSFALPRPQ